MDLECALYYHQLWQKWYNSATIMSPPIQQEALDLSMTCDTTRHKNHDDHTYNIQPSMKVDSKPTPTCSMCGSRCSSSWYRMSCTLDRPCPTCIDGVWALTVNTHQCKRGDKLCNACKKYWFKNMTPRPRQWRSDIVYGSGQYRRQRGMQNTKVWAECTKTKAVA